MYNAACLELRNGSIRKHNRREIHLEVSTMAVTSAAGARPSLRSRGKLLWRKIAEWARRQWMAIRPGPEARRGAVWGTLAAAAVCVVIAGLYLRTGFGHLFDFAFAIIFAAILIPLVALAVALLLTIARKLPRLATGMVVGCCSIVMLLWSPPQLGFLVAIAVGLAEGFQIGRASCRERVGS